MDSIKQAIEEAVEQVVARKMGDVAVAPDLVMVEDAAKLLLCDRSHIDALVKESPHNGFPAVRLGRRTVRIDRRRLYSWIAAGGQAAAA